MPARRLAQSARPFALTVVTATSAALFAVPAATAQAPAPAPGRTITATAAGRVTIPRDIARNSKAIGAAVEAAHDRAVRLAIANAREEAVRLAAAGGLTLGALVTVAEAQPSPFFGGSSVYGADGTFGPGKFCGQIRTPIRRRTASGRLQTVGSRAHFGCRIPPEVSQAVSATFAAG